jgi:hypothetical protein
MTKAPTKKTQPKKETEMEAIKRRLAALEQAVNGKVSE